MKHYFIRIIRIALLQESCIARKKSADDKNELSFENSVKSYATMLLWLLYKCFLTLTAAKVVCFSRLLKCLRSLYSKQCGPRSDCS